MTECYGPLKEKMTFSLITGALYIVFGILQAIAATGLVDIPLVPGNAMGVLVLVVIGATFLFGYNELNQGINEGVAYLMVGIVLSLIFGLLYVLVLSADAVSAYVVGSEDFEEWTIIDGIRPELYLAFLSLFAFFRWRDDISLDNINITELTSMEEEE